MDREHGPIPPQTLEWAAKMMGEWETGGAIIATPDVADLQRLASHATNVVVADIDLRG
jgi:hypothetical protein